MTPLFFVRSIGLGAGLSMDACAVTMANGMKEPKMPLVKLFATAALFALFQAAMPVIGYFAGHALLDYIGRLIPWIALGLLGFLGVKMIVDGAFDIRKRKRELARSATAAESALDEKPDEPAPDTVESDAASEECAPSENGARRKVGVKTLLIQAVATSIDALSVGLSIADYSIAQALIAAAIIALVTFVICVGAGFIGKKFGDKLGSAAVIVGGVILIAIGLEICLSGLLG